ncbi:GRAS family protein RAM1-like [Juglans microcarpa x Juglans regia]|uniref:GRAS family protein RAM1-like n=1 Tax=Juglans microcarpa x Juglans regia TaxID=2249226 RepID=UPI001B7E68E0|nr:GRAS family protein RAM1-like [Juglans microcarpa x Juglans regia]
MEMIEYRDEEELLNLSLGIVTDSRVERTRKRKRKLDASIPTHPFEGCDGKIFSLLQMREQMLKLDRKRQAPVEDGNGLNLIHLLLITATAVDQNKVGSALENLNELYRNVSSSGNSLQRVVTYFADGLAARLLTRKSPFYDMIMKDPTDEEKFFAFIDLYRVSPYYQFAHFTANQSIIEAFEEQEETNSRSLHVIDFDVSYGFQWPSLIQSLSEKASNGNRISLRITGFGSSLEELQETENRLVGFSKGFRNLNFDFQGLLRGSSLINIRKKKNETLAVNLVFYMSTLNNYTKISDTLKTVHSLNPSIVILVEQEGNRSPRSFLSRFMESLHYFAAMFDSLDDCLPLESSERMGIEKNHLGKKIKSLLNYDKGDSNCPTYERMETWKARMESHGFAGIKSSSKSMIQAKLLLKIRTHYCPVQFHGESSGGFRVSEKDDGGDISLRWQDRCLLTASAWHPI